MERVTAFSTFINAVLAGIALGIAGTVNLSVGGGIPGAFLFGFGLFLILCYTFKLYTGAIGYLFEQKPGEFWRYVMKLIVIWLGNFAGTALVAFLVRQTRHVAKIVPMAENMCAGKLADTPVSILILAIFCGFLMYVAVETFRRDLPALFRFAMVFFCVMVFILSGFEHCIANMYYFSLANSFTSPTAFGYLLLMTLGNSIGGWFLPFASRFREQNGYIDESLTTETLV